MHAAALDDRGLRRIIAMLVSFAAIAERAAYRSLPVRWLVLLILRTAETVALEFVVDTTQADLPCFDGDPQTGCSPEDAALLAQRFRMLAAALGALLPPPGRPGGCAIGHLASRGVVQSLQFVMPFGIAPVPDDTS